MVSKTPLWNKKDLPEPPVNTYKSLTQDVDLTKFRNALHEGIKHFKANNFLTSEAALLSRILYRIKTKFESSKDFKLMEKLRHSLDIYFNMNVLRHLNNIFYMVPTRYEKETYLPTKNMLNYVLVRLQGIVKLMERIYDTCLIVALELNKRLSVGHHWRLFLILFALVSRISILIRFNTKFLCELYGKLLPHSFKLQNGGKTWLPDGYVLPYDLRTWLSVQWVYEEEFIDLTFEPTNQIMNFFNLVDDEEDDDDVLFCDEYILLDDEDKQIEKEFYNLSPLKETFSRNRMRGFSTNEDDIGEEIDSTSKINGNTLDLNSNKNDVNNTDSVNVEEIYSTVDSNLPVYPRTRNSLELIEENIKQCNDDANREKYLNDEHNFIITIPDTPIRKQYNPLDSVIVLEDIVSNESQLISQLKDIETVSAKKKKSKKRTLPLSEKIFNKKLKKTLESSENLDVSPKKMQQQYKKKEKTVVDDHRKVVNDVTDQGLLTRKALILGEEIDNTPKFSGNTLDLDSNKNDVNNTDSVNVGEISRTLDSNLPAYPKTQNSLELTEESIKQCNNDAKGGTYLNDKHNLVITIQDTPMKEQYNTLDNNVIVLHDVVSDESQLTPQLKGIESTRAKKRRNKKRKLAVSEKSFNKKLKKTLESSENLDDSPKKIQQYNKNKKTVVSDSSIGFINEELPSLTPLPATERSSVSVQRSLRLNRSLSELSINDKKEKRRKGKRKLSSKNKSNGSKNQKTVNKKVSKFVEKDKTNNNDNENKGSRGSNDETIVNLAEEAFEREENCEAPINEPYDLETASLVKSNSKKSKVKNNKKAKRKKALDSLNQPSQAAHRKPIRTRKVDNKKVVPEKKQKFREVSEDKNVEKDEANYSHLLEYLGGAQAKLNSTKNTEQFKTTQKQTVVNKRSAKRLKRNALNKNLNNHSIISLSETPLWAETSGVVLKQNEILHDSPAKSKLSKNKKRNKIASTKKQYWKLKNLHL